MLFADLRFKQLPALINKAFAKGDDDWRLDWIQSRLYYIELAENLSYHIPGFRNTHNWFPEEIYFCATNEEVEKYGEDELKTQVQDLKTQLTLKIEKQAEDQLKKQKEQAEEQMKELKERADFQAKELRERAEFQAKELKEQAEHQSKELKKMKELLLFLVEKSETQTKGDQ